MEDDESVFRHHAAELHALARVLAGRALDTVFRSVVTIPLWLQLSGGCSRGSAREALYVASRPIDRDTVTRERMAVRVHGEWGCGDSGLHVFCEPSSASRELRHTTRQARHGTARVRPRTRLPLRSWIGGSPLTTEVCVRTRSGLVSHAAPCVRATTRRATALRRGVHSAGEIRIGVPDRQIEA